MAKILVYRPPGYPGLGRLFLEDGTPLPPAYRLSAHVSENEEPTAVVTFLADVEVVTEEPKKAGGLDKQPDSC